MLVYKYLLHEIDTNKFVFIVQQRRIVDRDWIETGIDDAKWLSHIFGPTNTDGLMKIHDFLAKTLESEHDTEVVKFQLRKKILLAGYPHEKIILDIR